MEQTKISVIIPSFNRRELLEESIRSVLSQTSPSWEAIIVDDGSDDGTSEMVETYIKKDPRIRLIKRDRNPKGAATCRNIGILHASHQYMIFLDSDDLMEPHCIEKRLKAVERFPESDFLVFQIACFSSPDHQPEYFWNIESTEDDTYRFFKLDAVWQTSGVTWKKNSVLRLGGFDENLHCWQDVDIHLRALMAGFRYEKFLHTRPDVLYRRHDQASISQQQIHSREKLQSRKEILSKVLLMADDRPWMVRELRWMAANIIASAANSHQFVPAYNLLFRSWMRRILRGREIADLVRLVLIQQSRLERFTPCKKLKQKITDRIIWKNTICQIPITQQ